MDAAVAASGAPPRFQMVLVLVATTATLIATCGIYGLMAYTVAQRRREIGVRMTLGAWCTAEVRVPASLPAMMDVAGRIAGLANMDYAAACALALESAVRLSASRASRC